MKKTITMVDVGDVVRGNNGISTVKLCVHGEKYYAYLCDEKSDDYNVDTVIDVSDDDINYIPCCS